MKIELTSHQLSKLIEDAAEMGANLALSKMGIVKPYLKKSEAYRLKGRVQVEQWIEAGIVNATKDGNYSACYRINRLELEAIDKAIQLNSHL